MRAKQRMRIIKLESAKAGMEVEVMGLKKEIKQYVLSLCDDLAFTLYICVCGKVLGLR